MRVNDSEPLRSPTEIRNRTVDEYIAQSLEQLRISLDLLKLRVPRTWGWIDYRAYVMDPDGHIVGRFDLMCADDATAKLRAELLADHEVIELWQGFRRVARFEPTLIVPALEAT
ncbi:hypothetical protein QA640_17370 [Bradyrhizobium sp. CB82]|uniref:hypothetical protein n=1 Tax=Bradyrhizobium sp. CB82 TaxID=3039159 RepID=UPI0024B28126|nr:hypothetical protein [Bradyrhizobium sp. CB82]WFU44055.1 hypothetical protein QA640_17370 [Bradyrhizobium sp. CB82]